MGKGRNDGRRCRMTTFTMAGDWRQSPVLKKLAEGLRNELIKNGYVYGSKEDPDLKLVLHFVDPDDPRHFRIHKMEDQLDRKSTRLNSSHVKISYAVFCLKKKKEQQH